MTDTPITRQRALVLALCTHVIWGSMPVYLLLVDEVPPLEYVAWRTLFTLPICMAFIIRFGMLVELRRVLSDRRTVGTLMASSCMIAINWFGYVWAIQNEYVYAASLGYYILPLNMMLLGFVFLKEKLTRTQAIAVALAAIGVAALAAGALTTMWISLLLGMTFGIYGLLRKTVGAGPLVGLTTEAIILLPLVLGYLGWLALFGDGVALGRDGIETLAIIAGGPMTAIPLLLFATAARALPYSTIGFIQFISPTIVFLVGLLLFGEELVWAQLVCFVLIWSAIALFVWDMLRGARNSRRARMARGVAR